MIMHRTKRILRVLLAALCLLAALTFFACGGDGKKTTPTVTTPPVTTPPVTTPPVTPPPVTTPPVTTPPVTTPPVTTPPVTTPPVTTPPVTTPPVTTPPVTTPPVTTPPVTTPPVTTPPVTTPPVTTPEVTVPPSLETFRDYRFEDAAYIYDGTARTLAITGIPDFASVSYDAVNVQTEAGVYPLTATVTAEGYVTLVVQATLTIRPARYDMSGVVFSGDTVAYDGESHSLEITGILPSGVSVSYEGNGVSEVGEHLVTAKFTGDARNYEPIPDRTALLTVTSGAIHEIRWILEEGIVTTKAAEGTVPVPPAGMKTEILKEAVILAHAGWETPIVRVEPGDTDISYRAAYTAVTRTYEVSFRIDGKELARVETPFGALPVFPDDIEPKEGYHDFLWIGGNERISGDTVIEGIYTVLDGEQIEIAYETSLLGFSGSSDNNGNVYAEASALVLMLLEIRSRGEEDACVRMLAERSAAHLKNMVNTEGATPYFDLEPYWCYVPVTAAIALAKETPAVWGLLDEKEVDRYDFVMECFAYVLTFGTDDDNNYNTGPGMIGNYNKGWNPNYRLANVMPMVFVGSYFGGAANLNGLLHAFSYDAVITRFEEYGFTRAYQQWTKEDPVDPETGATLPGTRIFMEAGGPAYTKLRADSTGERLSITEGKPAGTGVGVRTDYTYQGYSVDEVSGIVNALYRYNYSGGKVTNGLDHNGDGVYDAYIMTGKSSPLLGEIGMMKEFNSGSRSSSGYCSHDFMLVMTSLFALESLSLYDIESEENAELLRMIYVGNTDFLFKYAEGYMSTSGYSDPAPNKEGSSAHFRMWKVLWLDRYGHLSIDDFPEYVPETGQGIASEDFSVHKVDVRNATTTVGPLQYGADGKDGTITFQTVAGEDRNTVLRFFHGAGSQDPLINLRMSGGLAAALGDYTSVRITISLAKDKDLAAAGGTLRLRASQSSDVVPVFRIGADGAVYLGSSSRVITTLNEKLQRISVVVDFKAGTMTAYVGDGADPVAATSFSAPQASEASTTIEWLATLKTYIFNWYMGGNSTDSDRVLYFDDLLVDVEGEPDAEENPPVEEEPDPDPEPEPSIPDTPSVPEPDVDPEGTVTVVIGSENFTENEVDADGTGSNKKVGALTCGVSGKTGVSMRTEEGSFGDRLLVIRQTPGAIDPQLNMSTTALAQAMGDFTKLTITMDLSKLTGTNACASAFRLRATSASDTIVLFNTTSSGDVYLGSGTSIPLALLSDYALTLTLTLEFKTGMLIGYVNGTEMGRTTVGVPSASSAETLLDWLATTRTLFNWHFWGYSSEHTDIATLALDNLVLRASGIPADEP